MSGLWVAIGISQNVYSPRPMQACIETVGKHAQDIAFKKGLSIQEHNIERRQIIQTHLIKIYRGHHIFRQCFCGNELPKRAVRISSKRCNMKCPGNKNGNCGGTWAMNVYLSHGEAEMKCKSKTLSNIIAQKQPSPDSRQG